ncbi:MAG: hypothetical protein WCJ82_07645 [Actinomycetota bacterium]
MSTKFFPRIEARNLEGLPVVLPQAFTGSLNVAILAFARSQQALVDSWTPWLDDLVISHPQVAFYEIPTISGSWKFMRRMIDGGMAAAIRTPKVLKRTMTVYGDVRRLTGPLEIQDQSTITLLVVTTTGVVVWSCTGAFDATAAATLREIVTAPS